MTAFSTPSFDQCPLPQHPYTHHVLFNVKVDGEMPTHAEAPPPTHLKIDATLSYRIPQNLEFNGTQYNLLSEAISHETKSIEVPLSTQSDTLLLTLGSKQNPPLASPITRGGKAIRFAPLNIFPTNSVPLALASD